MKKILAIIMAAIIMLSIVSCAKDNENADGEETEAIGAELSVSNEAGKFEYEVNDNGEYEIINYTPASVKVIAIQLPTQTADGREISAVGDEAFKAQNSISSVTIPDTYSKIGKDAFYDCDALTTVTMADSIKEIGDGAFQACDLLTSVKMSNSVSIIESRTFVGCVALTSIDLSGAVVVKDAFLGCSELTSVTVSEKLESLDKKAFLNTPKLQYTVDAENNGKYLGNAANPHIVLVSVADLNGKACTVNNETKVIATGALANCTSLEKVVLGAKVKFVNEDCFTGSEFIEYTEYENMYYLGTAENPHMVAMKVILPGACETLKLHENVNLITKGALSECVKLKIVNYPKTEVDWNNVSKAEGWNTDMSFDVKVSA